MLDYWKNFYESSEAMLLNRYISYAINLQYSHWNLLLLNLIIEARTERDTQSDIIARFRFWGKKSLRQLRQFTEIL